MSQFRNTLTARSVLLSLLLGTQPPRLPVRLLVRTAGLFGIAEGTARTALSRMVATGELDTEDGWYGLASQRLLARQARQDASREGRTRPWRDGRWLQAVVVTEGRRAAADRSALRAALADARLAELREGVWMRPDNLGDPVPRLEASAGRPPAVGRSRAGSPLDQLHWFRAAPRGEPTRLAARLWDLTKWAARAGELSRWMDRLVAPLERGDRERLADGFVLSADVLRHFQADPLLPAELLPTGWPGVQLRRDYERYDAAYRSVLRAWMREQR